MENYKEGKKEDLINEYYKNFKIYCDSKKIVSEFIRFHPILENAQDLEKYTIHNVLEKHWEQI